MANRYFVQFFNSLRKKLTMIECSVTIGATGAVGTVTGAGISSASRSSTGIYVVTLMDKYKKFLNFTWNFVNPTGSAGTSAVFQGQVYGVADTMSGAGAITLHFRDAAGTLVDPTQAHILKLSFWFDNTTVLPKGE